MQYKKGVSSVFEKTYVRELDKSLLYPGLSSAHKKFLEMFLGVL